VPTLDDKPSVLSPVESAQPQDHENFYCLLKSKYTRNRSDPAPFPFIMLEPLIALGAVANVTQFIGLAIKIFAKSRRIYHSADGSLVEYDDLERVTGDVSTLSRKLQESLAMTATSNSLTVDEEALCNLCKGCVDVSQELATALENLKSQGKPGRFRSFRQALKSIWSKDYIENLERRMKTYREELNLRIVVGLRFVTPLVLMNCSDTV
jgi:hypothetical protein